MAETSARMTLRAATGMISDGCPGCAPCQTRVSFPPVCKSYDHAPCSCPYVSPSIMDAKERREVEKRWRKSACRDGSEPGQWWNFTQWEADTCHYR